MCKYILKSGNQCKLSPKIVYCHIHSKIVIKDNLKKEIINLNKTIEKKVNKIKELENNLEFFKNEVNELHLDKTKLACLVNKYKEDYNKYQIIKQYEILKNKLININPNSSPYKILTDYYYSDIIQKTFNKHINDLKNEFITLRKKRIEYCHPTLII